MPGSRAGQVDEDRSGHQLVSRSDIQLVLESGLQLVGRVSICSESGPKLVGQSVGRVSSRLAAHHQQTVSSGGEDGLSGRL